MKLSLGEGEGKMTIKVMGVCPEEKTVTVKFY